MRGKIFFKLFFTILLILLLVVAATMFSLRPVITFSDLWNIGNFNVPVFLLMSSIIVILSLVFTWIIQYALFRREKKLSEELYRLNNGNYKEPIELTETNNIFQFFEHSVAVKDELDKVREKMLGLSRDVQELSSMPHLIGTETKEEILEQERHRIARELHDSVSQQLFAAMMMLSALNEKRESFPPELQKSIQLIESIVNESQSEMRALLLHLRPVKLEGKTLRKGIEQLLTELRTKVQLNIKSEIMPIDTIPGIEDHLFRIVQEILSNTLRHAKAKSLEVYLLQNEQEITLRVFDDGVGFDTSVKKSGSYGLMNIRERVSGLGGICKIISFPKQGTIVDIRIPNTE